MREEEVEEEEEPNWFPLWEEDLPKPEELMPLSQSLISSHLALAFNIPTPNPNPNPQSPDDSARTLKRPRLVWTPQLHKRFVDAVAHVGIKNAVPKTIMQLMSVDGLTRENVASHLQKYRLYLKRIQGLGSSSAAEQLFASNPNPLQRQDSFLQFMAPPPMLRHRQQLAAVQQQYHHPGQMRRFGSVGAVGVGMVWPSMAAASNCYDDGDGDGDDDDDDDVDLRVGGGRRVLTLFPTCGED